MKSFCDKTFTLTTNKLKGCPSQSALETVHSVECGLSLSSHSFSLQRNQFFYQ